MNKKYTKLLIISAAILAISVFFAACRPADYSQLSLEDETAIEDILLSTYFIEKPADIDGTRATVPVHNIGPRAFESGIVDSYPERGQTTTFSVKDMGSNLYKITSVTGYNANPAIEKTTEVYYILDLNPIGSWGIEDPVVTPEGVVDNLYRETFETAYYDKTKRYYEIDTDTTLGSEYAKFDIGGDMRFIDNFDPDADVDANWSSKTDYFQDISKKFSLWSSAKRKYVVLVGSQYYTEHGDTAAPTRTFVAYERVVDLGDLIKGRSVKKLKKYLWSNTADDLDLTAATLATTVIRYEIDPDLNKRVRVQSIIHNDFGDKILFEADTAAGGDPSAYPYTP